MSIVYTPKYDSQKAGASVLNVYYGFPETPFPMAFKYAFSLVLITLLYFTLSCKLFLWHSQGFGFTEQNPSGCWWHYCVSCVPLPS